MNKTKEEKTWFWEVLAGISIWNDLLRRSEIMAEEAKSRKYFQFNAVLYALSEYLPNWDWRSTTKGLHELMNEPKELFSSLLCLVPRLIWMDWRIYLSVAFVRASAPHTLFGLYRKRSSSYKRWLQTKSSCSEPPMKNPSNKSEKNGHEIVMDMMATDEIVWPLQYVGQSNRAFGWAQFGILFVAGHAETFQAFS